MEYRRLGGSGLKVSLLSYGSWVTYGRQVDVDKAVACMGAAYEAGVNFFDNAETYEGGRAEEVMGEALRRLGWRRASYLVSTKIFFGMHEGPNEWHTLNRKKLREGIDGALKRFGLDYIDLVFCHRPDPETPIEETVRSMHMMVESGKALYWGTSEWSAAEIMEAVAVADRHHLHRPQMEQPQYNLFVRRRVEKEFSRLYRSIGLGLTTFSPLASGVLSGKYDKGIPQGSRLALPGYEWLKASAGKPERIEAARLLQKAAGDLGCTSAQMALAWCASNPDVSTVITGASSPDQVKENMKALEALPRLSPEARRRLEEIAKPASDMRD